MDSFETIPTIKNLRALVETIRITELERCLLKIKHDIPKKMRRAIEDLSRGMMNKVLHGPMEHLRYDESNSRPLSEILENMHALNKMFSLEIDASILEQKIRAKMEQYRKES
ncbi:hypothetical protein IFM89_022553 [Coptis chinensis]|uniref:Tetrapyrrole biosynthesis glutamyl-tRNA reductase dimerisation domain-containing protein n=1 Tax=Coptis chinensis TaxID=261450 RepID=A0A835ICG1_9MAGN|nr:hypothetical protein IFM89_022553 [Coptis chinensis]